MNVIDTIGKKSMLTFVMKAVPKDGKMLPINVKVALVLIAIQSLI
tara:strand:+ start:613 stop:747 length:135 start_codon:yes stop_codon:yes gene_type:complete